MLACAAILALANQMMYLSATQNFISLFWPLSTLQFHIFRHMNQNMCMHLDPGFITIGFLASGFLKQNFKIPLSIQKCYFTSLFFSLFLFYYICLGVFSNSTQTKIFQLSFLGSCCCQELLWKKGVLHILSTVSILTFGLYDVSH